MTQITVFRCDGCEKTFGARDEKGNICQVGGMRGFFAKKMMNPATKILENKMLQYDLDFCEACNAKLMKFAMKELGVK